MSTTVSMVYLHVVEAVVGKLREEFLNEGVDDSVLTELQALWELKMMQCGAIHGPMDRVSAPRNSAPITPVHDLNVPYEGTEEYETPTAEMLFPPTPLVQTPMQTPLPVEYQYFPVGPSEYGSIPETGAGAEMKAGRPPPYMQQQSPWMNHRPLGVDVNVAYEEGRDEEGGGVSQPPMKDFFTMTSGKRKREDYPSHFLPSGYIPQQDGSGDAMLDHSFQEKDLATRKLIGKDRKEGCFFILDFDPIVTPTSCFLSLSSSDIFKVLLAKSSLNNEHSETLNDRLKLLEGKSADLTIASLIKMKPTASTIPQNDGLDNAYDDGVSNEDYNTPTYYDPLTVHNASTPKPTKSEAAEDDEPPLNEDDDDDLDDLEQGDEEPNTNHLVLAQFEKVTRTKSKWKCTLKDGVMRLNNKDILFTKASGEFDF